MRQGTERRITYSVIRAARSRFSGGLPALPLFAAVLLAVAVGVTNAFLIAEKADLLHCHASSHAHGEHSLKHSASLHKDASRAGHSHEDRSHHECPKRLFALLDKPGIPSYAVLRESFIPLAERATPEGSYRLVFTEAQPKYDLSEPQLLQRPPPRG